MEIKPLNKKEMKRNHFPFTLAPIVFAFFIMGYVDLIGISTNYMKKDFALSDTEANAYSVMVFVWFFVLSVPTSIMMNRIGRKRTVLLSMLITLVGMVVPLVSYSKATMLLAFACLGIGNTLMQVSLNPLIASMVDEKKTASILTLGQFVKAVASFSAPLVALYAAQHFNNWLMLFLVFAIIDVLSFLSLIVVKNEESQQDSSYVSFASCLKLLGKPVVLALFCGILVHVGIDVGTNISAPKLLQERLALPLEEAGLATSFYFIARTVGCFSGTFIMSRYSAASFFRISVVLILVGVVGLLFSTNLYALYTCVGLVGLGNSNVFSIIFANALSTEPQRNDEISGLMIMGVSGGAVFPIIMGLASDAIGSQVGTVIVLVCCTLYLTFLMTRIKNQNAS